MPVHVKVDPELCVGTADCVRVAPQAFTIDDTDDVATVTPEAPDTPIDQLRQAAYECPTGAIIVEE